MAKILVVDDEEQMRKVLRRFLEAEGHQVFEAADGVEALAVMKQEEMALAFVDLGMPVMDGFELLRHMSQEFPDVKAITNSTEGSVLDLADREASIVASMEKPFTRDDVLRAVAGALE